MDVQTLITQAKDAAPQWAAWARQPQHAIALGSALFIYTAGWWSIFARSGFGGALGLLMLVPGLNVVMFLVLAFGAWPAASELRSLRKLQSAVERASGRYSRAA